MTPRSIGLGALLILGLTLTCFPAEPDLIEPDDLYTSTSTDTTLMTPTAAESTTLLYIVHPEGDANLLADLLMRNPNLRMTFIFPPRYFDLPERKQAHKKFKVLQSSGQIEVSLTLENEPNLPLLGNFHQAAGYSKVWNVQFEWPDDIAAQIARGSGQYQKKWGRLPAGFTPPFGYLSTDVTTALDRFRMTWCLGKNRAQAGLTYFGRTALLQPADISSQVLNLTNEKTQIQALVDQILTQPFSLVDGSLWLDKSVEISFFKLLATTLEKRNDTETPLHACLAQELEECLSEQLVIPQDPELLDFNYSPWLRTTSQKQAWTALASARQTVETYKNSGRATLQKLDAALEEIYSAESGSFLLSLGQNLVPLPLNERNFIATLANVYRLCGVPVPQELGRVFSNRKFQKEGTTARSIDDPFFIRGTRSLTWNDSLEDDAGAGSLLYPTGNYPKGFFDLKSFRVTWNDSHVTFTAQLAALIDPKKLVVNPLIDIYLDVNRLNGAGSTDTLPLRGPTNLTKAAAWEYAISFSPTQGVAYQSLPGKEPRRVGGFSSKTSVAEKTISVSVPMELVRGSPDEWRYTVAMGGLNSIGQQTELAPIPVLTNKGEKNFGGAMPGRMVPRFIDLLAESVDHQKSTLKVYESGGKALLPYVEPE